MIVELIHSLGNEHVDRHQPSDALRPLIDGLHQRVSALSHLQTMLAVRSSWLPLRHWTSVAVENPVERPATPTTLAFNDLIPQRATVIQVPRRKIAFFATQLLSLDLGRPQSFAASSNGMRTHWRLEPFVLIGAVLCLFAFGSTLMVLRSSLANLLSDEPLLWWS